MRISHTRRLVLAALFAALMIAGKEAMAFLPNVEVVSLFLVVYTAVYRAHALLPLYVFVAVEAVIYPYPPSVVMYLYVWLFLFGAVMLLPRDRVLPAPVYAAISGLFGLLFGVLCAPTHAAFFGLGFEGALAWVVAGFPFDIAHAVGNFALGFLAYPLIRLLKRLESKK
jgi:energy-coupling factor transport system substrate-specific component